MCGVRVSDSFHMNSVKLDAETQIRHTKGPTNPLKLWQWPSEGGEGVCRMLH